MIEKGKGPVVGKLQTIQLIEANLQIIIRIFINYRVKGKIEQDSRISKANYRSRGKYSIENTILEKRIIYDYSIHIYQHTIYNMTDLEACYDRQLPNIGSIIQESVGVERRII